ncbi:Pathogenesis-related protein 1 [Linum perenne]
MASLSLIVLLIASLSVLSLAQDTPADYLRPHNQARAAVRVPPMRWDNRVAAFARNYGNKIKANCDFKHSGGPYGENLAFGRPDITVRKSIQMWVDEKKFYNCRANRCTGGECGHYTQVVWKDSNKLGCAKVKCDNNKGTIVICNYSPPGNVRGRRPYQCLNSLAGTLEKFIDQYV